MIKFKFRPPYQANGKTAFPESKKRSGVYLIKEDNKIVYVGYSAGNLYKTMYRHFQRWHHSQQQVVTYKSSLTKKSYTVRIVYCTIKQAEHLEKALIKKHEPRDNEKTYDLLDLTAYDNKVLGTYLEAATEPAPF